MVRIVVNDREGIFIGSTYYTPIEICIEDTMDVVLSKFLTFVLLLPFRDCTPNSMGTKLFYCITEHWTERTKTADGLITFSLPKIDDTIY